MTVFYFTATGNSLAVAKRIGGTLVSIPQVIDSDNLHYKDDVIGIVSPIYWWNFPIMVRRFLDKVQFEADYIFAIGTYGSISGGAMVSFQNQAKAKGYRFDYTNEIVMLDNYIPVFEMGAQARKLSKKNVAENIDKIVADINNRKRINVKAHLGKRAMTAIFKRIFKPQESTRKYIVDEKCNTCGICSQVCLAKNITVNDKVVFHGHCEGCMACLHLCPQNALHHKKEKSDMRWCNPDVSLKEVVSANNRTI